jgi:hypothetical protein
MANYKITNITNTAGKREIGFNTILSIEYVDSMMKRTVKVKPGEVVFLKIHSLPMSVRKLRVKKFISVVEITDNELKNSMNINKPVITPPVIVETPEEVEIRISSTVKKKQSKKTHENVEN